jgi:hypothetical protein
MKKNFCKQCGREIINTKHGSTYCRKHGYQLEKYGKFLDANPRNKFDPNEFRFIGNIVEMDTYKAPTFEVDKTYLIDAEDYPIVSKYKWVTNNALYAVSTNKKVYLHRLITDAKPGQQVDHININVLDNRKQNLRICGNSLNSSNRKSYNELGFKGVEYHKSKNLYSAYFRINYKQYHSPCYKTKKEAVFARFILEQIFREEKLTQFTEKEINSLTLEQKESIINGIKKKFNIK